MAEQDIISTIKDYLHIYDDVDALTLLTKLRDEMHRWHPDRALQNSEESKVYEEKFKELSSLSRQLKKYISENKDTAIVLASKAEESKLQLARVSDQINALEQSEELSQRIKSSETLNEIYRHEIEKLKKEKDELERKLEEHNTEMSREEREELIKLFSVPLRQAIGGWISFAGLLFTFIPKVHTFLIEELDVVGRGLISILWAIVLFCIYQFLYTKGQRYFISNAIEYMTDPNNIQNCVSFKEKSSGTYSSSEYVSQSEIAYKVRRFLMRSGSRFFFVFAINKAANLVSRNIIAHYLRFGVFKDRITNQFDTLFLVNRIKDIDNDDAPF